MEEGERGREGEAALRRKVKHCFVGRTDGRTDGRADRPTKLLCGESRASQDSRWPRPPSNLQAPSRYHFSLHLNFEAKSILALDCFMAARASTTITLTIIARRSCRALNVGEGRNATLFRPLECGAEAALDTEAALHRAEAGKQSSPSVRPPSSGRPRGHFAAAVAILPPCGLSRHPAASTSPSSSLFSAAEDSFQKLDGGLGGRIRLRNRDPRRRAFLSFFPRQETQDKGGRKKA